MKNRGIILPALSLTLVVACLVVTGCGKKSHPELRTENFDFGEILDGHMDRAARALASVRDENSARVAAGRLDEINHDLDDLVFNTPRLSAEGQRILGKQAAKHLETLQETVRRVNRSPLLADILGGQLATMGDYLTTLATGRAEEGVPSS